MKAYFLIIPLLLLLSCGAPGEDPEFLGVKEIEVTKVEGTLATLRALALFKNPNKQSLKLKKVDVDVILEGKTIGKIREEMAVKIPGKSDFEVPLKAAFSIGDIGLLNGIISLLGGKKAKVTYKGTIEVSRFGYPITVPVEYSSEVRL